MAKIFHPLVIIALSFLSSGVQATPILDVDSDGVLTGAKGVEVRGTLYTVEFLTGRCLDIYDCTFELGQGGPETINFFGDRLVLVDALYALYDQVFVDGPLGNFGSDGSLINGCQNTTLGSCTVQTPFVFRFIIDPNDSDFFMHLISVPEPGGGTSRPDEPSFEYTFGSIDYSEADFRNRTWARWSNHVVTSAVPVPTTLSLLGIGVLGLSVARRKLR